MPRNVEIKASVADWATVFGKAVDIATFVEARILCARSANVGLQTFRQSDTFYKVPQGRLKLRCFPDTPNVPKQLIYYERSDEAGPKLSSYCIIPVTEFATPLPVLGTVQKRRHLLLHGTTRIHLDHVEGLGTFLELEVVLDDDETTLQGYQRAHELMLALGVAPKDLVKGAYLDLQTTVPEPTLRRLDDLKACAPDWPEAVHSMMLQLLRDLQASSAPMPGLSMMKRDEGDDWDCYCLEWFGCVARLHTDLHLGCKGEGLLFALGNTEEYKAAVNYIAAVTKE